MNRFTWIGVDWTSVVISCLLHFCLWTVIIASDGRKEEREAKERKCRRRKEKRQEKRQTDERKVETWKGCPTYRDVVSSCSFSVSVSVLVFTFFCFSILATKKVRKEVRRRYCRHKRCNLIFNLPWNETVGKEVLKKRHVKEGRSIWHD